MVLFREAPYTGESRKLPHHFRGPFKIAEVLCGYRYRTEDHSKVDGQRI